MGILKDALNLGYITLDQYKDLAEDWEDWGFSERHSGSAYALQNMFEDMLDLGFLDLVDAVYVEFDKAITFYEDLYEGTIYYDIGVSRWRNTETGQFVGNPDQWLRD